MFEPILKKPSKGDPYFTTKAAGGYSICIKGKPIDPDCDVLRNCVGLALGIFHKQAGRPEFDLLDSVNAGGLIESAKRHGLRTGTAPELGALIVWKKNGTKDGGHVASVQEIGTGGEITTAESGYNAKSAFWQGHYKRPYAYKDGYTFLGFIYLPSGEDTKPIKKGDKGQRVREMQSRLSALGYLRKNEIDGDFGKITLGALCAYQLENGLTVDGVCGAQTRKKLWG